MLYFNTNLVATLSCWRGRARLRDRHVLAPGESVLRLCYDQQHSSLARTNVRTGEKAMRTVILSVLIPLLLLGATPAVAQLPPEILADSYLLRVEQAIREGDHTRARAEIDKIIFLQKQHELNLPEDFLFRYAKAADSGEVRRRGVAEELNRTRREIAARRVQIPTAPDVTRRRFGDLPAAIRLTPGELQIAFSGAEDLAAKLVELSQAMANDWSAFLRAVEEP